MRTRVKICGITRVEDAVAAARVGADAIGLVFYANSPRYVEPQQAARIVSALPPFVSTVGLFVDAPAEQIRSVSQLVRLDFRQFRGDESPALCDGFGRPYLKAVRVRPETNLLQYASLYTGASALLLDAFQEGVPGGTGHTFDWNLIPAALDKPVILAGGLNPENVGEAVRRVRPYAVDVSGGVEQGKGIKDAARIAAFMRGVAAAANQTGTQHGQV